MARPSESLNDLSEEGTQKATERQQEREQQAPATAVPTSVGLEPLSLGAIQAALGGAILGSQGETKGPEVMLTRDINGPTTYKGREVYQSNPRVSKPNSNSKGDYLEQNVYRTEEALKPGSIDEERRDYDEYSKGGFLANDNDRINQGVVTAAGGDPEKYEAVFQAAVAQAAYIQKASAPGSIGSKTTVEDVLNGWIKDGLPDSLKGGGGGGGGGPRAFTNIDTRVDLTDKGEARRIVNNALTGALGREATGAETRAFMKALNMNEKANPVVTTSKGVTSASGTTSTTTSEGGFDSADFADRYAKSQEGYAEYQTATTYLDSFINALESDSRVI